MVCRLAEELVRLAILVVMLFSLLGAFVLVFAVVDWLGFIGPTPAEKPNKRWLKRQAKKQQRQAKKQQKMMESKQPAVTTDIAGSVGRIRKLYVISVLAALGSGFGFGVFVASVVVFVALVVLR